MKFNQNILIKQLDVEVNVFADRALDGRPLCLVRGVGDIDEMVYLTNKQIKDFRKLQKSWRLC